MNIKSILIAATIIFGNQALADLMKPATLDITCVEQRAPGTPRTIKIVSSSKGSSVTLNGRTTKGEQLIGGSEGGAPYLQAVSNIGGYNITISGGSFEKAILQSVTILKGQASASVSLFGVFGADSASSEFDALCSGKFSFED